MSEKEKKNELAKQKRRSKAVSNRKATSTKITKVGKAKYINELTGELEEFNVIEEADQDFNFDKIWLGHLLNSLDLIGNKKIKVLNWLLKNKDANNQIVGTQRFISEEAGVSLPIVNQTLKTLISVNALKLKQTGVYILNPELMFKGGHSKRMNILLKYTQTNTIEHNPKEEKQNEK